jgi:hypothetical protein
MKGRVLFAAVMAVGLAAMVGLGAPGRSVMQSPGYGDCRDRRPAFSWSVAPDATKYLLSITQNGEKYLDKWTRKTKWAPRFDLPEGVYEARVIAYDGVGYGQWSGKVKFRRVFTPVVSSINGLIRDGGNVNLVAGGGISIETVASNRSVVITANGITSTQIVAMSVTTEKINDLAVTYDKLADDAVTGPKLADGAVTELKLADGSVTSNKLAVGAVHPAALASDGAIPGNLLKWNGSAWVPGVPYKGYAEGDIAISPVAGVAGAIAIGQDNTAMAQFSGIFGGRGNSSEDAATSSAILGGENNQINSNALCSSIIAGSYNLVSQRNAIAAGRAARATNEGAFVWADSTGSSVGSWGANTVVFKANGGVRFQSDAPATANNRVQWVPGDASWQFSSDRNLKEGFAPVDSRAALEKVAALPMTTWRYKGYSRAHMGVMAQDFHAAFPLAGASDTMIDSADLQGASLAAIQGLHAELKTERARNDALEARIKALEEALKK